MIRISLQKSMRFCFYYRFYMSGCLCGSSWIYSDQISDNRKYRIRSYHYLFGAQLFIDADGKLINTELGAMSEETFAEYLQEYYGVD